MARRRSVSRSSATSPVTPTRPRAGVCDELGGGYNPQRLRDWFGEHREAAGIPTGTLHTLRHTAAGLALTAGVPVHIVAARLGDNPTTLLFTMPTCAAVR